MIYIDVKLPVTPVIEVRFNNQPYLRFEALDDVTTAPALAWGGEPSVWVTKLPRGVTLLESVSELTVMGIKNVS